MGKHLIATRTNPAFIVLDMTRNYWVWYSQLRHLIFVDNDIETVEGYSGSLIKVQGRVLLDFEMPDGTQWDETTADLTKINRENWGLGSSPYFRSWRYYNYERHVKMTLVSSYGRDPHKLSRDLRREDFLGENVQCLL